MMILYAVVQDSSPAGTIFAEDIVDVTHDHEESRRDAKVSRPGNFPRSLLMPFSLTFSIAMCSRS